MIQRAAEALEHELRGFPWFVSVGVVNGTVSNPLHRELIVYTNRSVKKLDYQMPLSICEIPIRVENTGNPRPLAGAR